MSKYLATKADDVFFLVFSGGQLLGLLFAVFFNSRLPIHSIELPETINRGALVTAFSTIGVLSVAYVTLLCAVLLMAIRRLTTKIT